ncbi:siroheme synthase [Sphingomonas sp. PL-96]|uniref:precorrin-2 dehydrogenase/sirohydrochlorin ferrochelatase family protein n=1 Tax=Sphingomonas sp. PL-96 TaxID=2887201 RepID=UPI001E612388|nr:bifunctional precorrin-2 dehydrogenase/sirohydrochlorin ferrochelatase [Sphingomonas sp. PL-96]MCC2978066.1 siroheme synthase [Sphingomonas sp. PL-96]
MIGLPVLLRLAGRPVILKGSGPAADAKRRLLERAGAEIVEDHPDARLAVVALSDEAEAHAAIATLRARGILINAVDRPELCDFTLPAIVDRDPLLVAVATGGISAGLAAAVRQRLETLLPASLGRLAEQLHAARAALRQRFPDGDTRRRALGTALSAGGALDPLMAHDDGAVARWLDTADTPPSEHVRISLRSPDPDELTLREARLLARADRLVHAADVPAAILDRARADADRIVGDTPPPDAPGLTILLEMMR